MRIRLSLIGAAIAAITLAMSCASSPPAAEPETPPPAPAAAPEPAAPAPAPSADAPDEKKAQAAELRKKAFDLGVKEVLPEDYAAAEKAYALGNEKYGADNAASAAAFEDAIALYAGAIERGLPLIAAKEGDKAREAESAAYRKGAAAYWYDQSDAASSALAEAEGIEASGAFERAIEAYRSSASAFAAIGAMCDAAAARDAVAARDFAKWDPSNWAAAEGKLASARDLLAPDAKASSEAAGEARLRYELVMRNALGYYMADRKAFSETERDRASSIKAEVAVKEGYEAALALYASAEEKKSAEDPDAASKLYDSAAAAFAEAYDQAKSKMDAAASELDSLDAALETAAAR